MNNIFPKWWDYTITIYNKYLDEETRVVTWYSKSIDNCFWKQTENLDNIGDGTILKTSYIICRIPQNDNFKTESTWKTLIKEGIEDYFTLQQDDIIVLGSVSDVINEYQAGQRSTDLLNKYQGESLIVDSYAINLMTGIDIPHYKVIGK